MESQCRKCKQEKNDLELYCGVECYTCWEAEIDWEEVKKLREKLSQYLDIDRARLKAGLTLEQLKKVRKIISDNYVVGSDTRAAEVFKKGGKELIVALRTTGKKEGWQPSECLKKIDLQIERLEPDPEPKPELKIYTSDCPICNETFFCELEESDTSEKKASDNLSQQVNEHVKKIHEGKKKKKEREREREQVDPNEDKQKNNNISQSQINARSSQKLNESKIPLPLIIIGAFLLVGTLLIGCFLLFKKHKSKK